MNNTATARQELTEHVASASTATLAACLVALDEGPSTATTRTAAASVIEELVSRHAEVLPALDAWSQDLHTELSVIEATIAALPLDAL